MQSVFTRHNDKNRNLADEMECMYFILDTVYTNERLLAPITPKYAISRDTIYSRYIRAGFSDNKILFDACITYLHTNSYIIDNYNTATYETDVAFTNGFRDKTRSVILTIFDIYNKT